MPIFWHLMVLLPLLALAIPVAILIGQRWRNGPLISLSAGATLGVGIYLALTWAWLADSTSNPYSESAISILFLIGGAVLLLGAWALALTDALRERQRVWAVIQCALVYGSFVGMLGFFLSPVTYCGELPSGTYCTPFDYGRFAIFGALSLAGPIATLLYALLAHGRAAPAPDREVEQPVGAGD